MVEHRAKLEKYQLIKHLGSGHYSKVVLGRHEDTGQLVAIKLRKEKYAISDEMFLKEAKALASVKHLNISKLIDYGYNKQIEYYDGGKRDAVYLVIEVIPNGELFDYVALAGAFSEKIARHYFSQMIGALNHLHEAGFTHRDLKPENMMMDADFNLKLVDFGFAESLVAKDGSMRHRDVVGTKAYCAPEVLVGKPYYGIQADIFSAAAILFVMVSGSPPF